MNEFHPDYPNEFMDFVSSLVTNICADVFL